MDVYTIYESFQSLEIPLKVFKDFDSCEKYVLENYKDLENCFVIQHKLNLDNDIILDLSKIHTIFSIDYIDHKLYKNELV